MPEGPEVETVRRSLDPLIVGSRIESFWFSGLGLRNRVPKRKNFQFLIGQEFARTSRRGKNLLLHAEHGGLLVRLGMSGRFLYGSRMNEIVPHTHVRLALKGTANELRYIDPRRFGDVRPFEDEKTLLELLHNVGPDPVSFSDATIAGSVRAKLRSSKRSLKNILLDQAVMAGVGNIYASEALFVARLSPFRRGTSLTKKEADTLIDASHQVISQGIDNRGTTFSDYVDANGASGTNQHHLFVFARAGEGCKDCDTMIKKKVQSARATFYCPKCQRAR